MIRTAHLRVYLEEAATAVRGLPEAPSRLGSPVAVGVALTMERSGDDAYTTEWRGNVYRCPRTPMVRMLEGLLALRAASSQLGPPLFPQSTADEARHRLHALKKDGGVAHILTSAWHVPMRWFVPFAPDQREIVETPEKHIRYRQLVEDGLGRLDRAIGILERSDIPRAITAEVRELRAWLGDFPASAMVELDYGSVARFFADGELAFDQSVADLWESLDALSSSNWRTAGERYAALVERWALPMAIAYSN
ncbi:MAG: hypothetical protein OEQ47_03530 [Acidimicrobiia bacterium]|nr:hypothetical protein [Acidimicrobiia bacterium]